MIANTLRWILHWLGQGLKLWLFAALASICVVPIYLPLGLLEDGAIHFNELILIGKVGIVAGYIVCYAIGIAVFTAVLASQLKDHPLRSFVPSNKRKSELDDQIKPAEQDGGGQAATRFEST